MSLLRKTYRLSRLQRLWLLMSRQPWVIEQPVRQHSIVWVFDDEDVVIGAPVIVNDGIATVHLGSRRTEVTVIVSW